LVFKEIPARFKYFKKMVLCQAKLWRKILLIQKTGKSKKIQITKIPLDIKKHFDYYWVNMA